MNVGVEPHRVSVQLVQHDRSTFLSLVSTLHRRGVHVVAADLQAPAGEPARFVATFLAAPARAETAVASLRNLIDVLDAELIVVASVATAS